MRDKFQEKKLLYRIKRHQDKEAFGELYDRYIERLYRFVFLKVSNRDEAEDITADVFMKAWNHLRSGEYERVRSFSGFIYTVARTTIVDHYRKKGRDKECSLEILPDPVSDEDQYANIANRHEAERVYGLVKSMKREYQEIIVLRFVDELSIAEIAQVMNKSNANIRVTLHRALKLLKQLAKEE